MAARLLFFGKLRDPGADLIAAPAELATLSQLRAWLDRTAPDLSSALTAAKARVAIDGELTQDENASIAEAREVAFLPPMSGG